MRARDVVLLVPLVLAGAGCDDDRATGPTGSVDCSDEPTAVDIEVSSGTTPEFDWSPACRVAMLGVEADDGDRWWIGTEDENLIRPPVRYGVTPPGVPGESTLPLQAGETYSVVLWVVTRDGAYIADVEEFTP